MNSFNSKIAAGLTFASLAVTACSSDSTGPSNLDAGSALKSLAIGLQEMGGTGSAGTLSLDQGFGGIAPFLNQVTVNIDGTPQTMFGFALRESFPDGTCSEAIFTDVTSVDPTMCTPPPLGLAVMLWQSHSAVEPPDRMVVLAGNVGTSDFSFDLEAQNIPAVGLYLEGQNNLWVSQSGTLTSNVSAGSQACDIPLPPYVKSGHCNIASFDEQASIVLSPLNDFYSTNGASQTRTVTVPRQTLHGLWLAVTEVQPIGLTAARQTPSLFQRLIDARVRR